MVPPPQQADTAPAPPTPSDVEPGGVNGAGGSPFSQSVVAAEFDRALSRRDEVRTRLMDDIPAWYLPWGHLAATVGIGLSVLIVALTQIRGVQPKDFIIVPVTAILANYFEYRVHKKLLHRRWFPFQILYDRHTPQHHVVFIESDMAVRSTREFRLVLLPAFGVLGIVLTTAPFALGVAALFGATVGWLFLVTAASSLVSYEILHLTYHLSPEGVIGGSRLVSALRRHHARHHNPRYMQKWNFNVTVPLFDWVFGTVHKGD